MATRSRNYSSLNLSMHETGLLLGSCICLFSYFSYCICWKRHSGLKLILVSYFIWTKGNGFPSVHFSSANQDYQPALNPVLETQGGISSREVVCLYSHGIGNQDSFIVLCTKTFRGTSRGGTKSSCKPSKKPVPAHSDLVSAWNDTRMQLLNTFFLQTGAVQKCALFRHNCQTLWSG